MTDDEFDKACNFLLEGLRDLRPVLAKELTKILNGQKYKGLSKKDRKINKGPVAPRQRCERDFSNLREGECSVGP